MEQRRPPCGCTSSIWSRSEGWDWPGRWMTSLRPFTVPGPLLWSWGWRAGGSAARLWLLGPPDPSPTPPHPTPILPRGSSLPHRCVPPWRPSCPSHPVPCPLLLLPRPGRQGKSSCKCPRPQSASDSLTDPWWVLQDPSNFIPFDEIPGIGPFHTLTMRCTKLHAHLLLQTTGSSRHFPFPSLVCLSPSKLHCGFSLDCHRQQQSLAVWILAVLAGGEKVRRGGGTTRL